MTDALKTQVKVADDHIKKELGDDFEVVDPTAQDLGSDFESVAVPGGVKAPEQSLVSKLGSKAYHRFWGDDVEDPIQWTRLGTTIAGGMGGASLGMETGGTLGGIVGSFIEPGGGTAIGAGVGAAIGAAVGSATGSYAGAGAPEHIHQLAESIGVVPPGSSEKFGLDQKQLQTVMEGEGLIDAVTSGGITAARMVARPIFKWFTGVGKEGRKIGDEASRMNINMLPVQIGDRAIPRGFVAVMGKFPLVAAPMRRRMISSQEMYQQAFENLPADIAPIATIDAVSSKMMIDAKDTWTKVSEHFGKRYKDIFDRATQSGARVEPVKTADKVLEIIKEIKANTPTAAVKGRKVRPGDDIVDLNNFINSSVRPIFKATKSGVKGYGLQTFEQMDTLLGSIDVKIGEYMKKGWTSSAASLEQLKTEMRADMYFNIRASDPKAAANIAADFQATDKMYSETVSDLFENSVAQRFGTVKRGGIRGANFNPATRVNVDNLTEVLMRGESPSELEALRGTGTGKTRYGLVTPETYNSMVANVLEKRIQDASVPIEGSIGKHTIDVDKLAKDLGLTAKNGKRYQYTKKMLELAGGIKIDELEKMISMGQKIKSVEIPNPSMFVARRATMGGINAVLGSVLVAGTAAGHPMASGAGLVASLMTIGGARFIGHVITDPDLARSLKYVMGSETGRAARKMNYMRVIGAGARGMVQAGEWTEDEAMNFMSWGRKAGDAWDQNMKAQQDPVPHPPEVEEEE